MSNGIAIVLAWPETICKQAGAWYDKPLKWLGINKNNYYKVGHAAIVLIDKLNGKCFYFDFGRYHAPYQHGRVRSAETDHDLQITTKATFTKEGNLQNLEDILFELFLNESCHGSGSLHASFCNVYFEKALKKANQMQENSPIRYGPFEPNGTNCSRFVSTVLISGKPSFLFLFRLLFPKTLSPTPIGNVKALRKYSIISNESIFEKEFNTRYLFNK